MNENYEYETSVSFYLDKLKKISDTKEGWLGEGEGKALTTAAAIMATRLLYEKHDLFVEIPYHMFITEEGGVIIEFGGFPNPYKAVAVEILPDGTLELYGVSTDIFLLSSDISDHMFDVLRSLTKD